jgi:hypothetical protein
MHCTSPPALQLPLRQLILDQDLGYIDQAAAMSGEAAGGDSIGAAEGKDLADRCAVVSR